MLTSVNIFKYMCSTYRGLYLFRAASNRLVAVTFTLALLLLAGPLPVHTATLYKWIDENGVVHYSDQMRPEDTKRAHETLNNQGITIDKQRAQKTPEELERDKLLREQSLKKEQEREAKQRHDKLLLDSYRDEHELIDNGEEKVATIEATINIIKSRIKRLRAQLQHYLREAADLERSGKPVPETINQALNDIKGKIDSNIDFIAEKRREQDALRKQFAEDLKRYRELKAKIQDKREAATP